VEIGEEVSDARDRVQFAHQLSRPNSMRRIKPIALSWLLTFGAVAQAEEIVTLTTRPGVTQSYLLANLPNNPQAIALLFAGGSGFIALRSEAGQVKYDSDNFLVRSRDEFVKRNVVAAVIDAASDSQSSAGMSDETRMSIEHASDIAAVIAALSKQFPGIPVYLIGTSRGTVSAAAIAARNAAGIRGAVLTATVFRKNQPRRSDKRTSPGLSGFDFATIKVPLLLVHHVNDQCYVTPYADAARLSNKYPLISVTGGRTEGSDPCVWLNAHGFYGKESETVDQIVNWMVKKPVQFEVK
jgi:predicted alpha/beta hydrolase family esterase